MTRRLLNLLTALSLLLCVAVCGLWAGAGRRHVSVKWTTRGLTLCQVMVEGGSLQGLTVRGWPATEAVRLSYAGADRLRDPDPAQIQLVCVSGGSEWTRLGISGHHGAAFTSVTPDGRVRRPRLSESFKEDRFTGPMPYALLDVPLRVVAAVSAVPPLLLLGTQYLVHARRRRRRRAGLCPACAYDLTGNVSGVCPECGSRCRPT